MRIVIIYITLVFSGSRQMIRIQLTLASLTIALTSFGQNIYAETTRLSLLEEKN